MELRMALIDCTECGQEVSDKAELCPQCGNPLKRARKTKRASSRGPGGVFELVGFLLIVAGVVSCQANPEGGGTFGLLGLGFVVFLAGRFIR
jgi:predicted RNA-binding Zn-ribbon protein involved in translation (DUF1610 family)